MNGASGFLTQEGTRVRVTWNRVWNVVEECVTKYCSTEYSFTEWNVAE